MNWRAIRAVVVKDLRVVTQSRAVLFPIIGLVVIMMVVLPGVGGLIASSVDVETADMEAITGDMDVFFDNLPPSLQDELDQFDNELQEVVYLLATMLFAPLFLIIPIMVANVIAADSFVGEKERKTLEALIYSPTTDRELYIAKIIGPWVAAIVVAWVSFVLYAIVLNISAWGAMERVFFPNTVWIILMLWVVPPAAGVGLGTMVLVSSRVSTFQEAYQLGGMVVLPVLLLLFGQIGGLLYLNVAVVLVIGLVLWAITALVIWYGARGFQRGELIARL